MSDEGSMSIMTVEMRETRNSRNLFGGGILRLYCLLVLVSEVSGRER